MEFEIVVPSNDRGDPSVVKLIYSLFPIQVVLHAYLNVQ
jgi:hypothetical protein